MERALRDKKAICIFVLPALIWFCAIALFPVFQSAGYSLLDWDGVTKAKFIGAANYIKMFQDPLFFKSIWNSILLAAASVFIQLPISMILALVLAGGVRGENFYRNVFFVPVIISGTIIAHLWLKIYHPSYGLLNMGLGAVGWMPSRENGWEIRGQRCLPALCLWSGNILVIICCCFIPRQNQFPRRS